MAEDENRSRGSDEKAKETNERTGKRRWWWSLASLLSRGCWSISVSIYTVATQTKNSFASGQIIAHCQLLMLWRCSRRPL